jgi:ribonuclease P protein component
MVAEKLWPEDAPGGVGFFRPNLPRCERLSCWKKRSLIINRGKSIKYDNIFVSILPQANWELSVVVKKGSGKAFQRNEYKRKIKASFRLCKPHCLAPAAVAVTVIHPPGNLQVDAFRDFLINNLNTLLK